MLTNSLRRATSKLRIATTACFEESAEVKVLPCEPFS
jgi:hypothetical protein